MPASTKAGTYSLVARQNTELSWRIEIGEGSRLQLGKLLAQLKVGHRILIIYPQANWTKQLLSEVVKVLDKEGFQSDLYPVPAGEEAKKTETICLLWDRLAELGFKRQDTILSIGGGAISDMAGFAASTYLRGINHICLPTTLLGQVDASIGGKTGINLSRGKNLIGTFYAPKAVVIDQEILHSLPQTELESGMAEVVKYALLERTISQSAGYEMGPRPIFWVLQESLNSENLASNPLLPSIIGCCIRMKLGVILEDPYETGLRRCLNLGHTLGHAIERASAFSIGHGQAVSIGMNFSFFVSARIGQIDESERLKVLDLLRQLRLPTAIPTSLSPEVLLEGLKLDKKRTAHGIHFILPKGQIGEVSFSHELPLPELEQYLSEFSSS